ncbi:hypothetical protein [Pontibacter sp. SGAir0037]|uniref:hypothetical protein n=1 Tax=Pontibacter sp. SGAir0037 TaxID=2571030 RepID=UPI0010CD5BC3|nr:hypothetical protein [Pontibacter sp. SGAir0037]QCR22353.1 hypothetical protein C1N53_08385 [Pontibacter sp. SGAir0037]
MEVPETFTALEAPLAPEQVLQRFCATYPLQEAQREIWKWFLPVLKASISNPERSERLTTFFDHLERMLHALYRLHADPDAAVPEQETITELPDTYFRLWVLLTSPPE